MSSANLFFTYSETRWPFYPWPSATPKYHKFSIFAKFLTTKKLSWFVFVTPSPVLPARVKYANWLTRSSTFLWLVDLTSFFWRGWVAYMLGSLFWACFLSILCVSDFYIELGIGAAAVPEFCVSELRFLLARVPTFCVRVFDYWIVPSSNGSWILFSPLGLSN